MGAMKKEDIARVTWLQSPHLVVYYFAIVVKEGIARSVQLARRG